MPSGVSGTPTPPARFILHCQTTSFGALSEGKIYGTCSANIDDFKQQICECTQGFSKELL